MSVTVQHEIPRQHSGLPVKKLNADNFEQRDYSGVNDDIMSDLAAQIRKEKEDGLI